MDDQDSDEATFSLFAEQNRRNLERAVAARYSVDLATEAVADALEQAWRNWSTVRRARNPAGYVYRIAERCASRASRRQRVEPSTERGERVAFADAFPDVDLLRALQALSDRQRQVVVLTKGWGLTNQEVAELLGISQSSLRNHMDRGLLKLRAELDGTREER